MKKTSIILLLVACVLVVFIFNTTAAFAMTDVTGTVVFVKDGSSVTGITTPPKDGNITINAVVQNSSKEDYDAVFFVAVYTPDGYLASILDCEQKPVLNTDATFYSKTVSADLLNDVGAKMALMVWTEDTQEDLLYGSLTCSPSNYSPTQEYTDNKSLLTGNEYVGAFADSEQLYMDNYDRIASLSDPDRTDAIKDIVDQAATLNIKESAYNAITQLDVNLDGLSDYMNFALYNAVNLYSQFGVDFDDAVGYDFTISLDGSADAAIEDRLVNASATALSDFLDSGCTRLNVRTSVYEASLALDFVEGLQDSDTVKANLFTTYSDEAKYQEILNGAKIYSFQLLINDQNINSELPTDCVMIMYMDNIPGESTFYAVIESMPYLDPALTYIEEQLYNHENNTVTFPIGIDRNFTNAEPE